MVDLLLEGLISGGVDAVERRMHTRRMARLGHRSGLRHDPVATAPHMAQAFGEIGSGQLNNVLSGQLDGGYVIAWERVVVPEFGTDIMEHLKRHPAGHFVAVPLRRQLPGMVVQLRHPVTTPDECPWLPGGSRMHLAESTPERLFRVTAVDHALARRLVDERALMIRPRRSWAILGSWAVCLGPDKIRKRGRWSLRRELEFVRELARRADAL